MPHAVSTTARSRGPTWSRGEATVQGTELPDDLVARIADNLQEPGDLVRARGVSSQWRRVLGRSDLLAHHLERWSPGASVRVPRQELPTELRQQAEVMCNLQLGRCQALEVPHLSGASMLQLSCNAHDGAFLLGQLPVGRVIYWPLKDIEAARPPLIAVQHPGPLSALSVSPCGEVIVSASSSPRLVPGSLPLGQVHAWFRASAPYSLTLAEGLAARVALVTVGQAGKHIIACLRRPQHTQLCFWRVRAAAGGSDETLGAPQVETYQNFSFLSPAAPQFTLPGLLTRPEGPWVSGYAPRWIACLRRQDLAGRPVDRAGELVLVPNGPSKATPRRDAPMWRLGDRVDWRSALFSPCGKMLLSRAADDRICVWRFFHEPPPVSAPGDNLQAAAAPRWVYRPALRC